MHKRLIIIISVFLNLLNLTYANRGNSLTYESLEYTVTDESFEPKLFVEDLNFYLTLYYSVRIDKSEKYFIKYDWKKFLRYETTLIVKKSEMYAKLYINITQQQPYLFYRKKKNNFRIYCDIIHYVDGYDADNEILLFLSELNNKIEHFVKKYDLQ